MTPFRRLWKGVFGVYDNADSRDAAKKEPGLHNLYVMDKL